ncbi:MAG: class I SAM-dependent methyltransferase [Phycisphaerae bacterium]|nr:class I SAM-dependent methyltransferase [Phycisphaerae bacterium]
MHTQISSENPHVSSENLHVLDRYSFAWEHICPGGRAHLDFGCYDGTFLQSLIGKGIDRLVGVDVSSQAVEKAHQLYPHLDIRHLPESSALPFEDKYFTSITLLDVLEHVYDQVDLLVELRRVLSDDGVLIVTVPGRHIFSFLDMGNLKFRFPRLHRWHYCRKHSRQEYEHRYVSNPDGLVGDISARKQWHEHFSRRKMRSLLGKYGFRVELFDGSGLFARPLGMLGSMLCFSPSLLQIHRRIVNADFRKFESTNLFCLIRKALP